MNNKMTKYLFLLPFALGALHAADEEPTETSAFVLFEDEPTEPQEGLQAQEFVKEDDSLFIS